MNETTEEEEAGTHLRHVDAAVCNSGALPLAGRALERRPSAGVTGVFVGIIAAIVLVVTDHRVDDAARIVALEVIFAAGDVTASVGFVGSVLAVLRPIAEPRARNAHARPGTQCKFCQLSSSGISWNTSDLAQWNCFSSLH